eukprot:5670359-Pleurochrysis_carterae.AAC.1
MDESMCHKAESLSDFTNLRNNCNRQTDHRAGACLRRDKHGKGCSQRANVAFKHLTDHYSALEYSSTKYATKFEKAS